MSSLEKYDVFTYKRGEKPEIRPGEYPFEAIGIQGLTKAMNERTSLNIVKENASASDNQPVRPDQKAA